MAAAFTPLDAPLPDNILADSLARCSAPALSPALDSTLSDVTPAPDHADSDPLQSVLPQALPAEVCPPQVATPIDEATPIPSLDNIVGARVDPLAAPTASAASPTIKAGPGLRLPSFELLGIANPHTTTAMSRAVNGDQMSRQRLSEPALVEDSVRSRGGLPTRMSLGSHSPLALPIQHQSHLIETLTPPEENQAVLWTSLSSRPSAADPRGSLRATGEVSEQIAADASTAGPTHDSENASVPRIELSRTESDYVRAIWLQVASDMIVSNMRLAKQHPTPTKILSHALPSPSPSGFAFPFIISSLQATTPGNSLTWISVFHALPGKINLSDLPTSPPTTPGPSVGGDDYFTSQTFDSAVQVLDYQDNLTTLPRTPHPVVPPSTIGVSIVERYIPPTNASEFAEMFDMNSGRSLLVDRLVELSPDNGTLLFIYPTKAGADTFMRQYLGPIIDPLLRSMRTLHALPVDLASSLGSMPAVATMPDFDTLRSNISALCASLGASQSAMRRYSGSLDPLPRYDLELAQRHTVPLERRVWAANWWTKQEKTRVRETVGRYFRLGSRQSDAGDITPTSLIHAILDGVATRPYPAGREPSAGVEIGVFVIKRSA